MAQTMIKTGKPRPKTKVSQVPGGQIRITIPSTGIRPPKPKTFRQWAGNRGSKWMGKSGFGRAVRGAYRIGKRESEGVRERRKARAEGRDPTIPSRRSVLRQKSTRGAKWLKSELFTLDHRRHCAGCGQNFTNDRQMGLHACPQNHGPKKGGPIPKAPKAPSKAKGKSTTSSTAAAAAGGAAMGKAMAAAANPKVGTSNATTATQPPAPAPAPSTAQLGPQYAAAKRELEAREWRKHNAQARRDGMTRSARAKDRLSRELGARTGRLARCSKCKWPLYDGEDHDCSQIPAPKPIDLDALTASTPTAPTTTAAPKAPTGAKPQGKGPAMTAPATAPPSSNGGGGGSPGGGGGSPGGGAGTAAANALVSAKQGWANEMPLTHQEMTAKMEATRQAYSAMGRLIDQFAALMVQKGFHPETTKPLTAASTSIAESANHFTETTMAIEQVYAALLAHYRSGTPDPGQTYLSDGRRPPGA